MDKIFANIRTSERRRLDSAQKIREILARLDRSFLPRPTQLRTSSKFVPIKGGWLDAKILKALEKPMVGLSLRDDHWKSSDDFEANLIDGHDLFVVGFSFPAPESAEGPPSAAQVRELFVDLVRLLGADFGVVKLANHGSKLHREHYEARRRTFNSSGLQWLNFFGPGELARQGGEKVADNPHAVVERLAGGLLIMVGDSPQASATPDGERRLLAATAALPPLPGAATSSAAPAAASPAAPPEPTPETLAGVHGFRDPLSPGDFWVTRHIAADARLARSEIDELVSLRGQGTPPVRTVSVLFSRRESALGNADALASANVQVWFINPGTGERERLEHPIR